MPVLKTCPEAGTPGCLGEFEPRGGSRYCTYACRNRAAARRALAKPGGRDRHNEAQRKSQKRPEAREVDREKRPAYKLRCIEYLGGKCVRCGYNHCAAVMNFHHRDPSQKEFQIGGGGGLRTWEQAKMELDKCDLLCATCHREEHGTKIPSSMWGYRARDRARTHKRRCLDYLGGKCFQCGYNHYAGAMDFHHRDPAEKAFGIQGSHSKPWEIVKEELDKCDLLCANCHYETHNEMRS